MRFSDVNSDDVLINHLRLMRDEHRVPHSLLFHEDPGGGGIAVALAFAQYILCKEKKEGDSCGVCPSCNKVSKLIHPDIHFVYPLSTPNKGETSSKKGSSETLTLWREALLSNPYMDEADLQRALKADQKRGLIKVEQAKEMIERLNISSYEGGNKFMIVFRPERMNAEAANKLLKMVEEPHPGTIFIFIAAGLQRIMPTILSRCVRLRVHPLERNDMIKRLETQLCLSQSRAEEVAAISMGSWGNALRLVNQDSSTENIYAQQFGAMLDHVVSRKLLPLLECAAQVGGEGRESQKNFCIYAQSFIRKIYMVNKGLGSLAYCTSAERESVENYSTTLNEKFCIRSFQALDKAIGMIESNVNSKIVFCNLANRFFVSL